MISRLMTLLALMHAPAIIGATVKSDLPTADPTKNKANILLNPCEPENDSCLPYSNPVSFGSDTDLIAAYKLSQPLSVTSLRLTLTNLSGLEVFTLIERDFNPPALFTAGLNSIDFRSQECVQCILVLTLQLKNGKHESFGAAVQFGDDSGTLIGSGADAAQLGDSAYISTNADKPAGACALIRSSSFGNAFSTVLLFMIFTFIAWRMRRLA